jgi:thioredoxin-like negative regulator of GroEL
MREELEELFRPVVAESLEQVLDTLRDDSEFIEKILERFEQGRMQGKLPALSEVLSEQPENYREAFLSLVETRTARSLLTPKSNWMNASEWVTVAFLPLLTRARGRYILERLGEPGPTRPSARPTEPSTPVPRTAPRSSGPL